MGFVEGHQLFDPKRSKVADKLAIAPNPIETFDKGGSWLWAWSLGIPSSSTHADEAKKFIEWATSKEYINMIGEKEGWVTIPPGTRKSTYANQKYLDAAVFAPATLAAMEASSLTGATKNPVPYVGINFAIIPEMQAINNFLGQQIAAALTGKMSVILLTALQSLDREQIEAAKMDGAKALLRFRHVVLPHLYRPISVLIMLETIFFLSTYAEIYVTTQGGPGSATTNIPFYIFSRALQGFDVGLASAAGVFAIIIANIIAFFFVRAMSEQLS